MDVYLCSLYYVIYSVFKYVFVCIDSYEYEKQSFLGYLKQHTFSLIFRMFQFLTCEAFVLKQVRQPCLHGWIEGMAVHDPSWILYFLLFRLNILYNLTEIWWNRVLFFG